jgi:hypothetical protein
MTEQDMQDLQCAARILEFPTFTAQVSKVIGKPAELTLKSLPAPVKSKVGEYTQACFEAAFRVVLLTVDTKKRFKKASNLLHKGLVVATGATGGFFGGATMAAELSLSTGIMMRSIAEVAREEGEDLTAVESRLACIAVLGLDTSNITGTEKIDTSRYFLIRRAMADELTTAAEYLASNTVTDETAPIVAKFLNKIAERFGIQLTEKMVAELVPVIGAVTAASLNYLFIAHFQRIARGHFMIRRLERVYGKERIKIEYEAALARMKDQSPNDDDIVDVEREVAATNEDG